MISPDSSSAVAKDSESSDSSGICVHIRGVPTIQGSGLEGFHGVGETQTLLNKTYITCF